MTPLLHIVTPCTRLENLVPILRSILIPWGNLAVQWWIVFDLPLEKIPEPSVWKCAEFVHPICHYTAHQGNFWGGPQRSRALDFIQDGYVTFVDDDTIIHPDYFRGITPHLEGEVGGLLYGQELPLGAKDWRPCLLKWFDPRDPISDIEHAQMTIRRAVIGDVRHEGTYDNDKRFARKVYRPDCFRILAQTLSYYNWLRR
jgi:hypothetical protein